jgi:hypothetical protein
MGQRMENLRTAWRLFRSDSTGETAVAAVLVAVTVAPFAWYIWKLRRQGGGRTTP